MMSSNGSRYIITRVRFLPHYLNIVGSRFKYSNALAGCMVKLAAALFLAAVLVFAGCTRSDHGNNGKNSFTFEQACRLNGFSWIARQPQQHGLALPEAPCLGCTVDAGNHFCASHDAAFEGYVASLSDFRDVCRADGGEWMLMQPLRGNVVLSEKMCWGCMVDDANHICSRQEYSDAKGT